jgi:uncharacterized protein (TIGR00730 family)
MKTISIFLGSKSEVSSYTKPVQTLLDSLAQLPNCRLAYGGGTTGLMKEVLTACKKHDTPLFISNCTRWKCEEEVPNKTIETHYHESILDRQNLLLRVADAYVVCPGGIGTVFEFMQALTCNDMKETSKPIFLYNVNNYFMHLLDFLAWARKCGMVTKTNEELLLYSIDHPDTLIEKIKQVL